MPRNATLAPNNPDVPAVHPNDSTSSRQQSEICLLPERLSEEVSAYTQHTSPCRGRHVGATATAPLAITGVLDELFCLGRA